MHFAKGSKIDAEYATISQKKLQNVPKKRIINPFFATECEKMRNYIFSRKMITLLKKALKEV